MSKALTPSLMRGALLRGRRSLLYNLQDFVNAVLEHGGEVRRGVLHQEVT